MGQLNILLVLFTILTPAASLAAPLLNVDSESGRLLGAADVDLNGTLYDVELLGGSCESVFTGCNQASDFTFQTQDAAIAASQALLDQVFVNGPDGNFDSTPAATGNCTFGDFCSALTPYSVAFIGTFTSYIQYSDARNYTGLSNDLVSTGMRSATYINRWQPNSRQTWARWSLSPNNQSTTAVPEAPSVLLLGVGLLAMALARRARA